MLTSDISKWFDRKLWKSDAAAADDDPVDVLAPMQGAAGLRQMRTRFLTVDVDVEAVVDDIEEALDSAMFIEVAIVELSSSPLPMDMRNSCSLFSGERNGRGLTLLHLFIFVSLI